MVRKQIELVEDDESIRQMYKYKLELSGFEVSMASNGKEGLEVAEKIKPDLILLDLRMPVMSGEDMLKELRKTKWGAEIRVIVLTNVSKDEAPSILRILNVDQYIVKAQQTPAQVIEAINHTLED